MRGFKDKTVAGPAASAEREQGFRRAALRRQQRACLARQRDRPAHRSRRLSARHHPAQRSEMVADLRGQPLGGARGDQDADGEKPAFVAPKVGSWVEPRERWNLLDRDVLGWYAMAPDRESFLRTVQEFRHIIEPEATALAAERRTDEQMAEISTACREMGEATSLASRTQADTRFHLAILRASGNELLVPLGVLIEFGAQQPLRLRHARDERRASRPEAARGDRAEDPPAAPGSRPRGGAQAARQHRPGHRPRPAVNWAPTARIQVRPAIRLETVVEPNSRNVSGKPDFPSGLT